MKRITAWILKIEKGYREINFKFESVANAESFLSSWMLHKDSDDDYNEGKEDEYSLTPVVEDTDETLDDIPVQ